MDVVHSVADGFSIVECSGSVSNERDATDLIAAASSYDADVIVIPRENLGDSFFELKTRIAGEIIQKFVTYRKRVAILGDISAREATSNSLRDFVRECNRGNQVWFVADRRELVERLRKITLNARGLRLCTRG